MKRLITLFSFITILTFSCSVIVSAQATTGAAATATADTLSDEALNETGVADTATVKTSTPQDTDIHQSLKRKFIEGNAGFMSLVALALVLGLAFCIERIIYLSLSEIDAKRFVGKLEDMIVAGEIEQAKALSRDTRGPVASICYQGLLRIDDSIENIERSVTSYGSVQSANLEKGCSWITLFIAMAPSDTRGWRHQSNNCCIRYEGSFDYDYLRYHCSTCFANLLQLHPLKD